MQGIWKPMPKSPSVLVDGPYSAPAQNWNVRMQNPKPLTLTLALTLILTLNLLLNLLTASKCRKQLQA